MQSHRSAVKGSDPKSARSSNRPVPEKPDESSAPDTDTEDLLRVKRLRRRGKRAPRKHTCIGSVPGPAPAYSGIPAVFAQPGEAPPHTRIHSKGLSYYANVQSVESPDSFYVSLLRQRNRKKVWEIRLNKRYCYTTRDRREYGVPEPARLTIGLLLVVAYQGLWHRAKLLKVMTHSRKTYDPNNEEPIVTRTKTAAYKVLFIDDGTEGFVSLNQIRYMESQFLTYEGLATKCFLHKGNGDRPWSQMAGKRFKEIMKRGLHVRLNFSQCPAKDKLVWEVRLKATIPGYSSLDSRYVDIGEEIRSYGRRTTIASFFVRDEEEEVDRPEVLGSPLPSQLTPWYSLVYGVPPKGVA